MLSTCFCDTGDVCFIVVILLDQSDAYFAIVSLLSSHEVTINGINFKSHSRAHAGKGSGENCLIFPEHEFFST